MDMFFIRDKYNLFWFKKSNMIVLEGHRFANLPGINW